MSETADLSCENCGRSVPRSEASECGTMGDLDPDRWRTLCCPTCGARLETTLVEPNG